MGDFLRHHFAVVLAFALPLALIVIIAISVYIPPLFISTDYNFVYASCGGVRYYDCDAYLQGRYTIVNNRLVLNEFNPLQDANRDGVPDAKDYSMRLFLHDTKKNESREIALAEVQTLSLSDLLTSPDGVTVAGKYSGRSRSFFLFFDSSDSYGYYLTKGKVWSKLNLITDGDYYYQRNFKFVGWVSPGRN